MEQEKGLGLGELLHRAYVSVRRRIVLVLAVILIITGGGVIIANIRKPMYTASERVSYTASDSMTSSYFKTITGFCSEGCVVDRANFYFDYFAKSSGTKYKNVYEFINDVKDAKEGDSLYYDVSKRVETKYIIGDRIGVSASSSTSNVSYIFTIKYSDLSSSAAHDKVIVLLQAFVDEVNVKKDGVLKYFGVEINIEDLGSESTVSDWPKSKIVSIALVLGVIVALLSVYVINLTDRTVKEKSDLERITGTDLLAFIEDQGA